MTQQSFNQFSFLYPDAAAKQAHFAGKDAPQIDDFTFEELGLAELLPLKNGRLSEFATTDPRVIRYRQEVFADLLAHPNVGTMLSKLIPVLFDISDLRTLESENASDTNYLAGMTEIELYISGIGILHEGLCREEAPFESAALRELSDYIRTLAESDYYAQLNARLADLTTRVREIKSVTVGVNLDAQLRPREAGVLAINPEQFRSGDTLHKIMRLDFKDSEYTCIANLVPFGKKQSENQKTALSLAFTSAINDVYRQSLRSWKKIVQTYVLENTDFLLDLLPEFEFLLKGTNLLRALSVKGNTITRPTVAECGTRAFTARGLYNPAVALKIDGEIVKNDLVFDEKAAIYVLTGPNRGGKSVITCAAGLALAMTQLGLFVAADELTVSPADAIFTHFPTGADDTIDKGRLGEECARLSEILSGPNLLQSYKS